MLDQLRNHERTRLETQAAATSHIDASQQNSTIDSSISHDASCHHARWFLFLARVVLSPIFFSNLYQKTTMTLDFPTVLESQSQSVRTQRYFDLT